MIKGLVNTEAMDSVSKYGFGRQVGGLQKHKSL